jgi:hypothetical protein
MKKSRLVMILLLAPLLRTQASGYHPPFDRAVKEADLIVVGEVFEAWQPKMLSPRSGGGRIYKLRVSKAYKGSIKAGREVVFIDPYYRSTASYRVAEEEKNLTFLVKLNRAKFAKGGYDLGPQVLYHPIRNFSKKSIFGDDAMEGWLYLLDHFVAGKPGNKSAKYREIIEESSNRHVLHYVVTHYPKDLTSTDVKLLLKLIKRHSQDAYVAGYAIKKLAAAGMILDPETLKDLFESGSPYMRDDLLSMVSKDNVSGVQDLLFEFLTADKVEAEQETIDTLAKHAPGFLKRKLEDSKLPFWTLIPCLQALGINGSAVGKPDYPRQILSANPYTIRFMGEMVKGNEFWGVLAMDEPDKHKEWQPLFPLLEPTLRGPDTPIRRLTVALMRTFGWKVARSAKAYKLGKSGQTPPVRIEIAVEKKKFRLSEPVIVTISQIAEVDGVTMALEGPIGWKVERPDKSATMTGGFFHEFKEVDLERSKFKRLRRQAVKKTTRDISSWFDLPGRYRLSFKKLYPHDGGSHDLDAWTGMVFSEPIEIEIAK